MSNKVDILIPSKDRACQLHLLLSQLSKNVTGAGRITITIQASTDEFAEGYSLLKKRVANDKAFKKLRENTEIVYLERDSLAGIYDALKHLGESDYILPLTDDEIFHIKYDLENAPASRYFYSNPSVLTCAIRLGRNITPEVPESHRKALYIRAQPAFVKEEKDLLLWSWPDNIATYHWACIASTTGHIYRKEMYREWFNKYGQDNFLRIEGGANRYLFENVYRLPQIFNKVLRIADLAQQRLLKIMFGVYEQDVLRSTVSKFLFRFPWLIRKDIPVMMVSPGESVTTCLDLNSSQEGRTVHKSPRESNSLMNQRYLKGEVISTDFIDKSTLDEPAIRNHKKIGELTYIKY